MSNTLSSRGFWAKYWLAGGILAVITFVADQLNKWWMLYKFWPSQNCDPFSQFCKYEVMPFLNYLMVWNPGISYGLFPQHSVYGKMFLIAFSVIVSIGLLIWLFKVENRLSALSIGLIIGGALGNAVDRYLYGAVADFFELHAFGASWYVFNIADVAIVAGVIGLLYESLFYSRKNVSNSA